MNDKVSIAGAEWEDVRENVRDVMDQVIDPSDLRHPRDIAASISQRLYENYGVVPSHLIEANEPNIASHDTRARLDAVSQERWLLLQAIWDARAEMGFDTDGDDRFHSKDIQMIATNHVREAREFRHDTQQALDDAERGMATVVARLGMQERLTEEARQALRKIIDNWEKGDLAEAVRHGATVLPDDPETPDSRQPNASELASKIQAARRPKT